MALGTRGKAALVLFTTLLLGLEEEGSALVAGSSFKKKRETLRIEGRVEPARGEGKLPAIVWVVLVGSSGQPRQERCLLVGGRFEFERLPRQRYTLRVESRGYATSILELRSPILKDRHHVLLALGPRLEHESLPTRKQATVDEADLRIPRKALRAFQKAVRASDKNRPEAALRHLRQAVELHPGFYQAWNNLGRIYLGLGLHAAAEAAFGEAIRRNPTNPLLHRNMGVTYLLTHQWDRAVKKFSKAVALEPSDVRANAYLGQALLYANRHGEAAAVLRKAVDLDPTFLDGAYHLGYAQLQLGQQAEALKTFNSLLKDHPGSDLPEIRKMVNELQQRVKTKR